MRVQTILASCVLFLGACAPAADTELTDGGATSPDLASGAPPVARCDYAGPSGGMLCAAYQGAGWTVDSATADCGTRGGKVSVGVACETPTMLGVCVVGGGSNQMMRVYFPGADSTQCAAAKRDCYVYAGGNFQPQSACSGALPSDALTSALPVFEPPSYACIDPLPGDPPGHGPNGKVCTWNAIAASTEEGRAYARYASCSTVYSQRPYYAVPPHPAPSTPDARLSDPTYAMDLAWVKSQILASACACCHSSTAAPRGTSQWYVEAPGNFMDSFYDSGLALGANWIDSTAFGAFDPAENNGFDRVHSGFPSTDPARMVAFFRAELAHRGKSQADFASAAPFGGPLASQRTYAPKACADGEGVGADGKLSWSGGPARYVYVLAKGSANPTVPPNLDLPDGTLWRLDVPYDGQPVRPGFAYGTVPAGVTQRFPAASAAPAPLVAGTEYYLYVLADVGIPITRCTFKR